MNGRRRPRRPGARAGEPRLLARHLGASARLSPLSFVAKSEVERWPVVGLFARLQRSVFIDRARRRPPAEVNATLARRLARGRGHRAVPGRHLERRQPRAAVPLVAGRRGAGALWRQAAGTSPCCSRSRSPTRGATACRDPARPARHRLVRRHGPGAASRGVRSPAARSTRGSPGATDPLRRRNRRKRATAKAEAAVRRAFHAAVVPARSEGPSPKAMDKRVGAGRRCAAVNDRRELRFSILLSGRTA